MAGSSLTQLKNDLRGRFGRFFYEREVPFGLALFRVFLPLSVLIPMVPRWFRARELYSADGAPASINPVPMGSTVIREGDVLTVAGADDRLKKLLDEIAR